ncbi:MAG: hypothetical protein OEY44_00680 [Candidatus Peregrinibacteria bacterium]|nr:hypothetical protein [Candidatus Peregrinibacteria bacterium]
MFELTVGRIRAGLIDTVVIDGQPGAGKTQFSIGFSELLRQSDIPFLRVGTDDDCLPRSERGDLELTDYHPGALLKEAVSARHLGGGSIHYDRYRSSTGEADDPTRLHVPEAGGGILLIEGVRAIEHTRQALGQLTLENQARAQYILLNETSDVASQRRIQRDIQVKGLPYHEAARRVFEQQRSINSYYSDLSRDLESDTTDRLLLS